MTIWRFPLNYSREPIVMPYGARVLTAQVQDGAIVQLDGFVWHVFEVVGVIGRLVTPLVGGRR